MDIAPTSTGITYGTLFRELRQTLSPLMGKRESEAIIRIIFDYLKGWSTVDMIVNEPREVSEYIFRKCQQILERLKKNEPIQYITSETFFYGLKLKVAPGVLIPRPETAELVDIIVHRNKECDLKVLDIATGSGCIAVALARNLRFPEISALELSEEALKIAKENAAALKVKVDFIHADIFYWEPEHNSLDIIVSNPPYIDESEKASMERCVLDYEPAMALFIPDTDPLKFYHRIVEIGLKGLVSGGQLYFEINPRHGLELHRHLESKGFINCDIIRDSFGKERFMVAEKR